MLNVQLFPGQWQSSPLPATVRVQVRWRLQVCLTEFQPTDQGSPGVRLVVFRKDKEKPSHKLDPREGTQKTEV